MVVRSVRAAVGTALVVVLAAGCGGVGGSGSTSGEGGTATLTMMGFGTGDEVARTRFDAANAAIAPSAAKAAEGSFSAQRTPPSPPPGWIRRGSAPPTGSGSRPTPPS